MTRALTIALALISLVGCIWADDSTESSHKPIQPASEVVITGQVVTGAGSTPVSGAVVAVAGTTVATDAQGNFTLKVAAKENILKVSAQGFIALSKEIAFSSDANVTIELQPAPVETVNVGATASATEAVAQVYDLDELLPANPGRPGAPLDLPGYPSETASGGVKAPQYFAPGVAGDHGEPIAQYIRVGDFLFPNNLPANAHGNGYADPNLIIPAAIGSVEADPGAFDVRHGNNAENLAVAYGLRPRIEPVLQFTGDDRDYDFISGFSPADPQTAAWLGVEVAGGNGFLDLPEQRHQYKINAERSYTLGEHQLTLFGDSYYGFSRVPGLVPIDLDLPGETIDPRQADSTHTAVFVASDTWQIVDGRQLQFSGFARDYGLDLKSNFGDGLIRQSEGRSVVGGNTSFFQQITDRISFSAGMDFRQDAPRNAELAHAGGNGAFLPVTENNFMIRDLAPYFALDGSLSRFFHYSVGVRRDQVAVQNTDLLAPVNSYQSNSGQTSPRVTLSFHAPEHPRAPTIALSYGEAFHINDPRIGLGTARGTPIANARAYQLVASDTFAGTQFRVALAHVTNSEELAKIDPDTGLPQDLGPSLIRSITVSAHRHFSFGSFQATFARAQAKDLLLNQDVPEAPRLIWDLSATSLRLPRRLQGSLGLEYVGAKPLGDGFTGVAVREIHGSVTRSFKDGLFDAGMQFCFASGYTGQTLETLQAPGQIAPSEQIVGVRKPSYAGVTFAYHFRRKQPAMQITQP
jgi:hypothetical protein